MPLWLAPPPEYHSLVLVALRSSAQHTATFIPAQVEIQLRRKFFLLGPNRERRLQFFNFARKCFFLPQPIPALECFRIESVAHSGHGHVLSLPPGGSRCISLIPVLWRLLARF